MCAWGPGGGDDVDYDLEALRDDYEARLIEEAFAERAREQGLKTGAAKTAARNDRERRVHEAAAQIWAQQPDLTIKQVAGLLHEKNKDPATGYGSEQSIRRILGKASE
jgi:hypothetical protein